MSCNADFAEKRAIGRQGERVVEGWLQARGWWVIPSYDWSGENGDKAPRMYSNSGRIVLPDLDTCKDGMRRWVEVKAYDHSPWNRKHKCNTHGIKRRHYFDYGRVHEQTGSEVWLAVIEQAMEAYDGDRVDTGVILLKTLFPSSDGYLPCQCKACAAGQFAFCAAPQSDMVYFKREWFKEITDAARSHVA